MPGEALKQTPQDPSCQRPRATALLAGAVVLCALCSVGHTFRVIRPFRHFTLQPWQASGTDRFSEMGRRYLPLREHLQGLDKVGFVSSYDHERGHRMMAQSLAAPTLVMATDQADVVVASFGDEAELDRYLAGKPFKVQQRWGNGVAVLARERP